MALFSRGGNKEEKQPKGESIHPLVGKEHLCQVCGGRRMFTRSWRRVHPLAQCPLCGVPFESVQKVYSQFQPQCPRCEEPLEQPGFDYGFCDGCGSKFEIVAGTKPGLLPNRQQREAMKKFGTTRRS